mgnify:FL=1
MNKIEELLEARKSLVYTINGNQYGDSRLILFSEKDDTIASIMLDGKEIYRTVLDEKKEKNGNQ